MLFAYLRTGMSASARRMKEEIAQALKTMIQTKGSYGPAIKNDQLFNDIRAQSEAVSPIILLNFST